MANYNDSSYFGSGYGSDGSIEHDRKKRHRSESSSAHRHVRPRRGNVDGDRSDNSRRRMECRMMMTKSDVAMLIGKGGTTIKRISKESNAWVNFASPPPGCMQQIGTFKGTVENVVNAVKLVVEELERGGEMGRGMPDANEKREVSLNLLVPETQIGRIIGRKGATVKKYQEDSGAKISIAHPQSQTNVFAASYEQIVTVSGTSEAVHTATNFIIQTVDFSATPRPIQNLPGPSAGMLSGSFNPMRDLDVTTEQQAKLYEYYAQLNNPFLHQLPEHYLPQRSVSSSNLRHMLPRPQLPTTGRTARGFSAKIMVEKTIVGAVIGKGGTVVKKISQDSTAFVHFEHSEISNAYGPDIQVATIGGSSDAVASAITMVTARIGEVHAELNRKREVDKKDRLKCDLIVPSSNIGWIIGRQGIKIKETIEASNADISVSPQKWLVAGVEENKVTILGTSHAINIAVGRIISQLNNMGMSPQGRRPRKA